MTIQTIYPATGKIIKTYQEMSAAEVAKNISAAQRAFIDWRQTDFATRAKHMHKAAQILRNDKKKYAELMTLEMGKPIKEGLGEVEKCAWACEYYAENAEKFLQPETITTDAKKSFVIFQPLGVVLAIMPWNFPFWQVFRFAGPALMAGNAGVLKHASNVPGCALAIEDIFRKADFPENLFRSLLIGSAQVNAVIENPQIAAVTITGSTAAGRAVAAKAGSCVKKTVLELGGSDAYIILADANLAAAVDICVAAKLVNSGQSCIAAKRFIVVESVYKEFCNLFVKKMASANMGDPMLEQTTLGPQARIDLRDHLHGQVQKSVVLGAQILLGGEIPKGPGAYYPPTVLANVKKDMPAYEEELFGPVAAIIKVKDEVEAVHIANDSKFGLGAAVFTRDAKKGERLAGELQAGSCFVNAQVHSDPRLPFGGIKESGYGRELSQFGIREFVNIKTIFMN